MAATTCLSQYQPNYPLKISLRHHVPHKLGYSDHYHSKRIRNGKLYSTNLPQVLLKLSLSYLHSKISLWVGFSGGSSPSLQKGKSKVQDTGNRDSIMLGLQRPSKHCLMMSSHIRNCGSEL